jgi:hypothetical protein
VRGARPAGAQVVAGGVTGAAPAAVEPPKTFTPGREAVRCSALLGDVDPNAFIAVAWLGRCPNVKSRARCRAGGGVSPREQTDLDGADS